MSSVALRRSWPCKSELRSMSRSDDPGEFGERRRAAPVGTRVDPEFVMPAAKVLHERMAGHDHAGGAITLEALHRSAPRREPPMVGLDSIVRVLLGGLERARHELIDHREERPRSVGDDLSRLAVSAQRRPEEPSPSVGVA